MTQKKNDFDQESYIEKVDSAHTQIKALEERIKSIELITTEGVVLKMFTKDAELRDKFESLIWKTIVNKAYIAFLTLIGAVILIPILSKLFATIMLKAFEVTL